MYEGGDLDMHGIYVNPGSMGFERILRSEYVDKTGLISLVNRHISSTERLVYVSRPRRFGKSFAAQMLCAYYDASCDSHALFDGKIISKADDYKAHLNQYNVICFDVTSFISTAKRTRKPLKTVPEMIEDGIRRDILAIFPYLSAGSNLTGCLQKCAETEKRKFVFIIDEGDALLREAADEPEAAEGYFEMLRRWFGDNTFTSRAAAGAYMTGILSMKKNWIKAEIPAVSEYPITDPKEFAVYTGFTGTEVSELCRKYGMDFDQVKNWYGGYDIPGYGPICNPYSVMRAINNSSCRSFWPKTSAGLDSLFSRIDMDFKAINEELVLLSEGKPVAVDIDDFGYNFRPAADSRDDILTLLIYLGYLTYRAEDRSVRVPNEEIMNEFRRINHKRL